jgi:hypothetical protein
MSKNKWPNHIPDRPINIPASRTGGIEITVVTSRTKRERNELLEALKALAEQDEACENSLFIEFSTRFHFSPSPELKAAHALITRIEAP